MIRGAAAQKAFPHTRLFQSGGRAVFEMTRLSRIGVRLKMGLKKKKCRKKENRVKRNIQKIPKEKERVQIFFSDNTVGKSRRQVCAHMVRTGEINRSRSRAYPCIYLARVFAGKKKKKRNEKI